MNNMDFLEKHEFKRDEKKLSIPIGRDNEGKIITADMGQIPHLLVSGATDEGKTDFVKSLLAVLIATYGCESFEFAIFNTKFLDYWQLFGAPNLRSPLLADAEWESSKFSSIRKEAEARIGVLECGKGLEKEQDIFLVLDDFLDYSDDEKIMEDVQFLLQEGERVKIHCLLVVEIPDKNLLLEKLNVQMPYQIDFVKLGEVLYNKPNSIIKLQCLHLDEDEVEEIMGQVNEQINATIKFEIEEDPYIAPDRELNAKELFAEAGKAVIMNKKATIGMLQRIFHLGFDSACNLMDQLIEAGVVGPEEGIKPRKILMTLEEFESIL